MVAYIPALIPAMPRWQNPLKGQPSWVGHPVLFLGNTAGPSPAQFTIKPRGGESQQSKANSTSPPSPVFSCPNAQGHPCRLFYLPRRSEKQKAALPPLDPLQRSSRILRFPEPEGGGASAGDWGRSCTQFHRPPSIRPATSQGWGEGGRRHSEDAKAKRPDRNPRPFGSAGAGRGRRPQSRTRFWGLLSALKRRSAIPRPPTTPNPEKKKTERTAFFAALFTPSLPG